MTVLKSIIKDEYDRLNELKNLYMEELENRPKGSIVKRKISKQYYYYLNYRIKDKVKSEYLGKEKSKKLEKIRGLLKQRKEIESDLKTVKEGIKEIEKLKIIKGYSKNESTN